MSVVVGVLIGGSAHPHPEEMPLEPFLSAQVKGFCGPGSCLLSLIRGGFVTMGDGEGRSQTKDVEVLLTFSLGIRAIWRALRSVGSTYEAATSVTVATVLVTVIDSV